jgi:4-diphosphocytidyl-2-C-methyl-D-erythritol kinase
MRYARAFAKINLTLVVGPVRQDGKHEVATVLQRVDLHDDLELEASDDLVIEGFPEDTLVAAALAVLAETAGVPARWRVRIEKRVPVAAGLGGGSSDAATALLLASSELAQPLSSDTLSRVAGAIGADVPFFLREGPQLATGDGTQLEAVELPTAYHVLLVLPHGRRKDSTGAVYRAFDQRHGALGFDERRTALLDALARVGEPRDLAELPRNDLASSALASRIEELGAFRADVSGAGPTVYGLFERLDDAQQAAEELRGVGRTWLVRPVQAVEPLRVAR